MWPPLVVTACVVFLSDIFIRRVQLDLTAMRSRLAAWVTHRKIVPAPATLARLSAKKAEIRERYQPPKIEGAAEIDSQAVVAKPQAAVKSQAAKAPEKQESTEEETMTGRLLAAKKAMKDNRWRRD